MPKDGFKSNDQGQLHAAVDPALHQVDGAETDGANVTDAPIEDVVAVVEDEGTDNNSQAAPAAVGGGAVAAPGSAPEPVTTPEDGGGGAGGIGFFLPTGCAYCWPALTVFLWYHA